MSVVGDKIINWIATHPTHDGGDWDGWCESKEYRECAAFGNAPSITPTDARAAYQQALTAGHIRTDLSWDQVPDGWFAYFSTIGSHWHVADKANGLLTMASGFCTTEIHPSIGWCSSPDQYISRAGKTVGAKLLGYSRYLGTDGVMLGSAIEPAGGNVTPLSNNLTEDEMPNYIWTNENAAVNGIGYALLDPAYVDGCILTADPAVAAQFSQIVRSKTNDGSPLQLSRADFNAACAAAVAVWRAHAAKSVAGSPVDLTGLATAVAALSAAEKADATAILAKLDGVDEATLATFGLKRI